MPKRRLADIATRHQVFLERFKAGQARNFAAFFKDIDSRTREVLNKLESPNLGDLSKKKLQGILADLRAANSEVLDQATGELFDTLEGFAGYEAAFETRSLQSVIKPGQIKLQPVDAQAAYSEALAQPLSATGSLLETFVSDWTDGELLRMNNVVQRAWGEGWTVQQLTSAIRGTKALNYNDGILATSRRNAESVARTSIQHVASMGRMATWQANKDVILGYVYVATLDSKTTQECRSLDGRHFPLGEGPVPPVHINCRSTTIADLDPSLDFLDEGATRSSVDGYVSADLSYYDWLKTQDESFIKEAIGPTRAKLFLDGGLSVDEFAKLNLGRNFQPLTLDEMKALEPLAFKRAGLNP